MTFTTINPATEEILAEYPEMSDSQVEDILHDTDAAFDQWRRVTLGDRTECLRALAIKLREGEAEYADLMTREMGKPLAQAAAEVQKCASVCDYYAEHAAEFLADTVIESDASRSFVTYRPLGGGSRPNRVRRRYVARSCSSSTMAASTACSDMACRIRCRDRSTTSSRRCGAFIGLSTLRSKRWRRTASGW